MALVSGSALFGVLLALLESEEMRALYSTSIIDLRAPSRPVLSTFKINDRRPGYSQSHWRKIKRERRSRVRTQTWRYGRMTWTNYG